jgi:hypothetical protein
VDQNVRRRNRKVPSVGRVGSLGPAGAPLMAATNATESSQNRNFE